MLPIGSMTPSMLFLVSGALAAPPDAQTLVAAWADWQPVLQAHARIPIQLDDQDLARVARGDVARERTQLQGIDRVVGAVWTDRPRDALWVAIIDDTCDKLIDGLTEIHLPPERSGQKLLYQHLAVPWPFTDRQWIIDIRNNADLYASSGSAGWERTWALADLQEQRRAAVPDPELPAPDAIWTPTNEGGWVLLEVGAGTLLIYHARADVGGAIPDDLSTRFALATLKGMLLHVVERSAEIPAHYGGDHPPISRPDGSEVPGW